MPKYKVLQGTHRAQKKDGEGYNVTKGGTFETDQEDLHKRYPERYQLVDPSGAQKEVEESEETNQGQTGGEENNEELGEDVPHDLAEMTLQDLKEYANECEVDITGARSKKDVIKRLVDAEVA